MADMIRQLPYLVPPPQIGDPRLQLALRQLGDRLLQLQYGAGQPPGQQQTEGGADQHGDAQDLDGVIQDLDKQEQIGVFDVEPEVDVIALAVVLHLEGAGDGPLVFAAQHGLGRVVGVQHEADDELAQPGGGLHLALGVAQVDVVHRQQPGRRDGLLQIEILVRVGTGLQRPQVVVHPGHLVLGQGYGVAGVQGGQYHHGGQHEQQHEPEPEEDLGGEAIEGAGRFHACSSQR